MLAARVWEEESLSEEEVESVCAQGRLVTLSCLYCLYLDARGGSCLSLGMCGVCLIFRYTSFSTSSLSFFLSLSGSFAFSCFFRVVVMMVSIAGVCAVSISFSLVLSSSLPWILPYLGMDSAPDAHRGLSQRSIHLRCVVVSSSVR